MVLAVERVLRLDLLAVGGVQRRLRRAERVEFVLRIEFRQHLVRLDLVADLAFPLDDPSADAESEVHLVFGADIPGELDLVADRAFFDRDGADRAGQRRFGLGFLVAASREQGERKNADKRADGPARWRMSGGSSQGESSDDNAAVLIVQPLAAQRSGRLSAATDLGQAISGGGRRRRPCGPAAVAAPAMPAAAGSMTAAVAGPMAAATWTMPSAVARPMDRRVTRPD